MTLIDSDKAQSGTTRHPVPPDNRAPLDCLFAPKSVAVIGATETDGSVGRTVLRNLITSAFSGPVYPINPKRQRVLGLTCYPSIGSVPEQVDLAVVVTPAAAVPDVIGQCADAGVRTAIVISAGFKEMGPTGVELEERVLREARRGNIRLIGPNCLGVMNPITGLNATFAASIARPGTVAFLSQSGALCTAVLDWSLRENVGFSAFVSTGSMLDVGWGDLIAHFGDDPGTKSILIYMESVGDVSSFLSAARQVALSKPIIVIKAGRTASAAQAAASHTGAMTGSDEVLDAAFRRAGILRVDRISDLFYMAEVLSKQPRAQGPRLTILTNAGGPAVLATDALVAGGGQLAPLLPGSIESLNEILPPHWSHGNPIDILGDAGPERYGKALDIALADPNSDGLLVVLTPQDMTSPTATAKVLQERAHASEKPVLASWMGGDLVKAGKEILSEAGIPTFDYPDSAARAFNYMWQYSANLRALYETPTLPDDAHSSTARASAATVIDEARAARRTILTETESKAVLAAYGIPTVPTHVATSRAEAVRLADHIGYPVVLKVHSHTITHKTDIGGVQLNLADAAAVESAYDRIGAAVISRFGPEHFEGVSVQPMLRFDGYELILGSSIDSQCGPVLLVGTGGQLVEVFNDRALAFPPLNTTLARRLIEQTRIGKALKGVRGRTPVDASALEGLLVRFSHLVVEQKWIKEIDINPLLASSHGLVALDARVILHDPDTSDLSLPGPAIRPYPVQYVKASTLKNGTPVTIRPIRPEDEPLMVEFHSTLSQESVRLRYFYSIKLDARVTHERLLRVCFSDYEHQLVLVADHLNPDSGKHEIVGVGRLTRRPMPGEAEFAIIVSDAWHNRGLGTTLLREILNVAHDEGIKTLNADILVSNLYMRHICGKLGFNISFSPGDGRVIASIPIPSN